MPMNNDGYFILALQLASENERLKKEIKELKEKLQEKEEKREMSAAESRAYWGIYG